MTPEPDSVATPDPATTAVEGTTAAASSAVATPPTAAAVDLFARIATNERLVQWNEAKPYDLSPYFRLAESAAAPIMRMEGKDRVMLGSNNYLGLTGDPRVLKAAHDAIDTYGSGLTGSRLLNGTIPLHVELEAEIAEWMGTEDSIVFATGNQANTGALSALLGPTDTVIADSADHASILDGCILSKAKLRAFRHNRLDKLEKQLQRAAADGGGVLVVVDGVFSMEGDIAPVPEIAELCQRYGARLMVDEAHGAGVLGARGAGTCELLGIEDQVDLRMGTFSKSLASAGGFIAASHEVVQFLRLQSRPYLFTASAVPAAVGAALAALRIIRSSEGPELLRKELDNAEYWHQGLTDLGLHVVPPTTLPDGSTLITPIVPVLVGDDWKAFLLWKALWEEGAFVNVAVHPGVPLGGALLRTSVMATHERSDLDHALELFERVIKAFTAEHGPLPAPAEH